jgi:hypothetical protein
MHLCLCLCFFTSPSWLDPWLPTFHLRQIFFLFPLFCRPCSGIRRILGVATAVASMVFAGLPYLINEALGGLQLAAPLNVNVSVCSPLSRSPPRLGSCRVLHSVATAEAGETNDFNFFAKWKTKNNSDRVHNPCIDQRTQVQSHAPGIELVDCQTEWSYSGGC